MTRTIFIVWLSAGVLLGWFVSKIVEIDRYRTRKLIPIPISRAETS